MSTVKIPTIPEISRKQKLQRVLISRTSNYNFTSGGPGTRRLPDSAFTVTIPEDGWYELKLIGQMINGSTGAWTGDIAFAIANSTTPGSGLITDEVSGLSVQNVSDARGGIYYTSQAVYLTAGTPLYVQIIARNSLGTPTFSGNGFGFLATAARPMHLEAKKLADEEI